MAKTKKTAKVTTTRSAYDKPRTRRKVQTTKNRTMLDDGESIAVANLANLTRLDTATIARTFNICESTVYNKAKQYKDLSQVELVKPKRKRGGGRKSSLTQDQKTRLTELVTAGTSIAKAARSIGVKYHVARTFIKSQDITTKKTVNVRDEVRKSSRGTNITKERRDWLVKAYKEQRRHGKNQTNSIVRVRQMEQAMFGEMHSQHTIRDQLLVAGVLNTIV